ncbi:MAG: hypothetical protein Q9201_005591 [Fulgogasparrea decipioides]
MGRFTEKCKDIFRCKKATASEDPQPNVFRKLFKKSRSRPAPITATTSETLVRPEQTQLLTEAASPALAQSPQQISEENSISGFANVVAPTISVVIQSGTHDSPAKQSSSACNTTPSPDSRTEQDNASSRSSLSAAPFTVVSELPGSYTFHDAASYIVEVDEASALADRRDDGREGEARHWGGFASTIRCQRLEDPFRDFGMVAPFGPAQNASRGPTPRNTAIDVYGTFVRSTSEDGASSAALPMLSRTLGQDLVSTLDKKPGPAETASKAKPQRSIGHSFNEGIEASADKDVIDTQMPSAWERALESQERSFQNKIQDVREDHEAEVERYKDKITNLKKDVKTATDRKDYAQNLAKKREAEKDEEIALRDRELATAYADNDEKEAELKAKNSEIEEKEAKIKLLEGWTVHQSSLCSQLKHEQISTQMLEIDPLRQEVARLTALNMEHQHAILNQASLVTALQNQLMDQPDVTELQSALAEACKERDNSKADLQQCSQLWHQTLGELNQTKELIMSQNVRLQIYMSDHEDHPSPRAEGDTLLKKTQEQYRDLEKKANDCFNLWKGDAKKHENERIMLKAEIEERLGMINNLEGVNVLAVKEVTRLTDIFDRNVIANQAGSLDAPDMLQEMYEASQQTVRDLKTKNTQQQSQIAANEKENHQQKLMIRLRERMLDDKDAELKDTSEAKVSAEREVDELNTKLDMRDLAAKEDLDAKDQQIQWANEHIEDLEAHLESLMQAGLGGSADDTEACHQEAIFNLQQHIAVLQAENNEHFERQVEQRNKDMHDGQCAAQGEINLKVYQDNWMNAQEEIAKLKQHIELISKGCDPEKFEIAKDCRRLREEYGVLEKKYFELLDDTQETYWKCAAEQEEIFKDKDQKINFVVKVVEGLCAQLAETWFGGEGGVEDDDPEAVKHQQILDRILTSVYTMVGPPSNNQNPTEEGDEADDSVGFQYQDYDADVNEEHLSGGQNFEIFANDPGASAQALNDPSFNLPNQWEFISSNDSPRRVLGSIHQSPGHGDPCANDVPNCSVQSAGRSGQTFGVDYDLDSSSIESEFEGPHNALPLTDDDDDLDNISNGDQSVQETESAQASDDNDLYDCSVQGDEAFQEISAVQVTYAEDVLGNSFSDVEAEIVSPDAASIDPESAVQPTVTLAYDHVDGNYDENNADPTAYGSVTATTMKPLSPSQMRAIRVAKRSRRTKNPVKQTLRR